MTKQYGLVWRALDSVISQLSQAAVNLMTTLTFINILTPSDFGFLAAFWSVWMLLMSMNRAVFGEQLIAQSHDPEIRHGYLDFGFLWSALGILTTVVVAVSTDLSSLIPGVLCVALFVVSDMVRYGEMAGLGPLEEARGFVLMPIELIRLGASLLALIIALLNGSTYLSVGFALASSVVWIVVGLRMNGFPRFSRAVAFVRRKEKFEGLMAFQFLTGTGLSQVIPFLALHAFGAAQFGAIRIAQSILSPITLLTSAFQPSLIRLFAERQKSGRFGKFMISTILVSVSVASLMALIAVWGISVLGDFIIPPGQAEVVDELLLPVAVSLSFVVVGLPGGALIKVRRLGAVSFWGQVMGMCVTLILCVLATSQSIRDFVWALAFGSVSTVISTYVLLVGSSVRSRSSRVPDSNGI
ncbi:hypothetical protein [Pseudarthrobacter sp. H2]|uniref:hypothetical protein n=1 Tax=Pseudarthrobacter sp. H2 TaxID=3418415 RepID=UPI003CEF021D